ncbi:MAG: Mini-ribonuclease 3 [Fusobacteriaceae bacterium]
MVNIKETSGLLLAYLGDAVWELNVRKYFIDKGYNIQNANKASKNLVNAKKQSKLFCEIYDALPEEYKKIVNRAKNSNIKTFPKSCTIMEYKEATAFEALIAIFYENNENDKIKELIKKLEGDV